MSEELLNCPFCNGKPQTPGNADRSVFCGDCGVETETSEDWQRRALPEQVKAVELTAPCPSCRSTDKVIRYASRRCGDCGQWLDAGTASGEQVRSLVEAAARVVAHYNIVHKDMPEEMRAFSGGVALIGALEKALIPLDPRPRSSGSEEKEIKSHE